MVDKMTFFIANFNFGNVHCLPFSVEDLQTRTYEDIMTELEEYYKKRTPKVPENWNPKIF
jgi:hypothetical protein